MRIAEAPRAPTASATTTAGCAPLKILSLETGVRCDGRCIFCYQRDYRAAGVLPREPSTEELLARLNKGRRDGYHGVGFSGGEPTLRPDLVSLIRRARELGYARIAITTNGNRLADPRQREALLDAGLNAIGWSIQGARSTTHDHLTGVPGSFARLRQGLIATLKDAKRRRLRLEINSFTILTNRNHHELVALCHDFHALGVGLFVLQPLIYSRGNLAALQPLALSLAETLAAVTRVAEDGARGGYRVKTFNLPLCLLPERSIERERHRIKVVRSTMAERPATPSGFVRFTTCPSCPDLDGCPGLPASFTPQSAILNAFLEALDTPPRSSDELWLGGLELADHATLREVVRAARLHAAHRTRLVLCSGGDSILGRGLLQAAAEAGVDAVRFVLHRREPRSGDLRRATRGNLPEILAQLRWLSRGDGPRNLTREVGGLLERSEIPALREEYAALFEAGAEIFRLEVGRDDPCMSERLLDALKLIMGPRGRLPWARGVQFSLDLPAAPSCLPRFQRYAAGAVCPARDIRGHFVFTPFSGPSFGWVTDSLPTVALPGPFSRPSKWPRAALGPLVLSPPKRPLGGGSGGVGQAGWD